MRQRPLRRWAIAGVPAGRWVPVAGPPIVDAEFEVPIPDGADNAPSRNGTYANRTEHEMINRLERDIVISAERRKLHGGYALTRVREGDDETWLLSTRRSQRRDARIPLCARAATGCSAPIPRRVICAVMSFTRHRWTTIAAVAVVAVSAQLTSRGRAGRSAQHHLHRARRGGGPRQPGHLRHQRQPDQHRRSRALCPATHFRPTRCWPTRIERACR